MRILVKQQRLTPHKYDLFDNLTIPLLEEIKEVFVGPVAIDFETSSLDATDIKSYVRSIGIANKNSCVAIDLKDTHPSLILALFRHLQGQKIIAHNLPFDFSWIYRVTGSMDGLYFCTLAMFKHLSTEGWAGQTHGLKDAMVEVLGWPESNEDEVYDYMKEHSCLMAEVPWSILGPYNALDASAHWQLYVYFTELLGQSHFSEAVWTYHSQEIMTIIELCIENKFEGLNIDMHQRETYSAELFTKMQALLGEFINDPKVKPIIDGYNDRSRAEIMAKEPNKINKDGSEGKNWPKWEVKRAASVGANFFNTDSPAQLSWLFYEELGYKVMAKTDKGAASVAASVLPFLDSAGQILMRYRKLRDERKFLTSLEAVQRDGILHPNFKIPGTITGRLAGGIDK